MVGGTNASVVLDRISFAYPGREIFAGVSLTIEDGETVAIVGRSGAGKSTLLRLFAGILKPTAGSVWFSADLLDDGHRRIGFVFQDHALLPWLTSEQNIALALHVNRRHRAGICERIQQVAEQLSILEALPRYPHELSGGMGQRVALARALIIRPGLLCLDEPFSALDPVLRREARDVVAGVISASKSTTVLVTHDVDDAMEIAERIIVLRGAADGTVGLHEIRKSSDRWNYHSILDLLSSPSSG